MSGKTEVKSEIQIEEFLNLDELQKIRDAVNTRLQEILTEEWIKAIVKHEIEEVMWRVINREAKYIIEEIIKYVREGIEKEQVIEKAIETKILEILQSLNTYKIERKVAEEASRYIRLDIVYDMLRARAKEEVQKYEEEIKNKVREYVESSAGEIVHKEMGMLYDMLKDLRKEVSMQYEEIREIKRALKL